MTAVLNAPGGPERYQEMLEELISDEANYLSPWEQDFLEKLEKIGCESLNRKQKEKLESIWEKIFR